MKKIPKELKAYKRTEIFDQNSIPKALLNDHSTKAKVWGKIVVLEGELKYSITQRNENYILSPKILGVVEPEIKHRVAPMGNVKFYVEFYK